MPRAPGLLATFLFLVTLLLAFGLQPYDHPTWLLEVFPVMLALPLLWLSYRRFPQGNL